MVGGASLFVSEWRRAILRLQFLLGLVVEGGGGVGDASLFVSEWGRAILRLGFLLGLVVGFCQLSKTGPSICMWELLVVKG